MKLQNSITSRSYLLSLFLPVFCSVTLLRNPSAFQSWSVQNSKTDLFGFSFLFFFSFFFFPGWRGIQL